MSNTYVKFRIDCCHEDNTRDFSKTEELFNYCMKNYKWFSEQAGDDGFFYENGSILSAYVTDDMDEKFKWLINAAEAINTEKIVADEWIDGSEHDWNCNEYYAVVIYDGKIQKSRHFVNVNSENLLCFEIDFADSLKAVISRDTHDFYKGLLKNKTTGDVVRIGQLFLDVEGNPNFAGICELKHDDTPINEDEYEVNESNLSHYNVFPKDYLDKITSYFFGTVGEWEFIGFDKGRSFFDEVYNPDSKEVEEIFMDDEIYYHLINENLMTESELRSDLDRNMEKKFRMMSNVTPDFDDSETAKFNLDDFKKCLKSLMHCFSLSERNYLNNIMFVEYKDELYAGTTDGKSIISCAIPVKNNNYDMLINKSVVIDYEVANMILVYETDETELQIGISNNHIYIKIGDLCLPAESREMPDIGKFLQLNPPESLSIPREKLIKEFTEKSELQVVKDNSYFVEIPSVKFKGLSYLVETDYYKKIFDTSRHYEFYHRDTLLSQMIIRTSEVSFEHKISDFGSFFLPTESLPYIFDLIDTDNIEIKFTDEKSPVIIENDSCKIVTMPVQKKQ